MSLQTTMLLGMLVMLLVSSRVHSGQFRSKMKFLRDSGVASGEIQEEQGLATLGKTTRSLASVISRATLMNQKPHHHTDFPGGCSPLQCSPPGLLL